MGRWFRVVRTPVGIVGVGLLTLVLLLAVFAPILWGDKANAVDTNNLLAGPSAAALARHGQPRPRPVLPRPRRDEAVADPDAVRGGARHGRRPAARHGSAAARPPGRTVGRDPGQPARRLPRAAAGALLRRHLRRRCARCRPGRRPRRRPGFRAAVPDAGRRRRGARVRRRRPDRGGGRLPDPAPARAAQRRRAAHRQRHDHRRRHPAELRRAVLPRPGRAVAVVRLGQADAGRPVRHLRPPARRARARHHGDPRRTRLQPHRRGDRGRVRRARRDRPGPGHAAG